MSYFDTEYEIEKRIITGLRTVFEKDKDFVYNSDEEVTAIKITTDFPEEEERAFKMPHIVVSNVSFQDNLANAFRYNFVRDVFHNGMVNGAQQYARIIPYTLTLTCLGTRNDSKDLASKVHYYLSYAANIFFGDKLGLNISDLSKGQTAPSKQFPERIFETSIGLRGTLYWLGTQRPETFLDELDTPLTGVNIKFE